MDQTNGMDGMGTSITFGSSITGSSTIADESTIASGVAFAVATSNADHAWAANTSVLMRSQYFSCHTLAKGSMSYLSAIKILASCDILVKEMFDASFMAFIMPDRAFILAASTFSLSSPNFTS
jgi:hypothetical protein